MSSRNSEVEPNDHATAKNCFFLSSKMSNEEQINESNEQMKNDFMSYCYSFLNEDEEARQCVQVVWNKYLQAVGDVATLSAFFDTLPYHVKTSVLPKYQEEIVQWCENLFHIPSKVLLCSIYYAETFQRVIRYALKVDQTKKGIIYIPTDFDLNLKLDLTATISNIQFEHITNDHLYEDMINFNQLEELIKRDLNDTQAYPLMVIANAGSILLGRCDELTKIKTLCDEHHIWLHVTGDLLGSLALLPSTTNEPIKLSCDSLTIDIAKLFGIQNLPSLTLYLRSTSIDDQNASITTHSLYDSILHSPSMSFLSVWSISQRCSRENLLSHMKQAFQLTMNLTQRLEAMKTIEILPEKENQEMLTYERICSSGASQESLPKSVVIFRFQGNDLSEIELPDDFQGYIDLLNLWLFDKLSQQYPKMNLETFKTAYLHSSNSIPVHALRFAPLEHLLDVIDDNDLQSYVNDLQRFCDILLATMTARIQLTSSVSKYENLVSVPIENWAGIGAVRYIPSSVDRSKINETSTYEINSIQAELARQLQTNDSAFSLGGGNETGDSMFYLRLGMIRRREDLDVLLQKISNAGKDTETSLKYIDDMAEKIQAGIEKVQKDLYDENLQLLAQDGLLRQLPLVSNLMSWWSPAPSASPLATKGRSFDLNSGRVESTEDTYVNRMQIKRQVPQAPTHNDDHESSSNDNESNSNQ